MKFQFIDVADIEVDPEIPEQPVSMDANGHTYEPYPDDLWAEAVIARAKCHYMVFGKMDGYVCDTEHVGYMIEDYIRATK